MLLQKKVVSLIQQHPKKSAQREWVEGWSIEGSSYENYVTSTIIILVYIGFTLLLFKGQEWADKLLDFLLHQNQH